MTLSGDSAVDCRCPGIAGGQINSFHLCRQHSQVRSLSQRSRHLIRLEILAERPKQANWRRREKLSQTARFHLHKYRLQPSSHFAKCSTCRNIYFIPFKSANLVSIYFFLHSMIALSTPPNVQNLKTSRPAFPTSSMNSSRFLSFPCKVSII